MVGLLPDRPQRGKSGLTKLERVRTEFEPLYARYCRDAEQGRRTGEKALQSFLIRESYTHERRLVPINLASQDANDPVELVFVTDEIALPVAGGKIVCDILALRCDHQRSTPVLLELKDDRMLARLVEQVEGYTTLIDEHAGLFSELFGVLLGEDVRFDGPTEKWIVWPAVGDGRDPREDELLCKGIRVVTYEVLGSSYSFRVGRGVGAPKDVELP